MVCCCDQVRACVSARVAAYEEGRTPSILSKCQRSNWQLRLISFAEILLRSTKPVLGGFLIVPKQWWSGDTVHISTSEDRGKFPGLLSWAALQTQPASTFQNLTTVTIWLWEQADKLLPGLHKIHYVLEG